MEAGLHFVGYLLSFFLAFLYFPNLVFKYSAEYSVDLGRRRDSGELEEFFSAVIPCLFLNGFANLLLAIGGWLGCSWHPVPDWEAVAALMSNEHGSGHFLTVPAERNALLLYLALLLGVAFLNGLVYGGTVRRVTRTRGIRNRVPKHGGRGGRSTIWWLMRIAVWIPSELACLVVYRVWHNLYHEEIIELYRYAVQKPWVFVRMGGDRLYYGRFDRYDKAADGDVESVTLLDVRRYCYDEVDKCLSAGRLPLSPFQGPLRIAISEVTDIHTVPENHFRTIEYRYAQLMIRMLGRDLLNVFAGQQGLSVRDIYIRHAGGTSLTKFRYRQALRYLEDEGFVTITASTPGGAPLTSPPDHAKVDFPPRVASRFDELFHVPTGNAGVQPIVR
jgi:hypothetical protein